MSIISNFLNNDFDYKGPVLPQVIAGFIVGCYTASMIINFFVFHEKSVLPYALTAIIAGSPGCYGAYLVFKDAQKKSRKYYHILLTALYILLGISIPISLVTMSVAGSDLTISMAIRGLLGLPLFLSSYAISCAFFMLLFFHLSDHYGSRYR